MFLLLGSPRAPLAPRAPYIPFKEKRVVEFFFVQPDDQDFGSQERSHGRWWRFGAPPGDALALDCIFQRAHLTRPRGQAKHSKQEKRSIRSEDIEIQLCYIIKTYFELF